MNPREASSSRLAEISTTPPEDIDLTQPNTTPLSEIQNHIRVKTPQDIIENHPYGKSVFVCGVIEIESDSCVISYENHKCPIRFSNKIAPKTGKPHALLGRYSYFNSIDVIRAFEVDDISIFPKIYEQAKQFADLCK